MNCREVQMELSAYIDGALPGAKKAEITGHIEGCRECKTALAELQMTVAEIKSLEEVEPPDWLLRKIMARVDEEQRQKKGLLQRLFPRVRFAIPLTAVATVFVIAVSLYLFRDIYTQVNPMPKLLTRPQDEIPVAPPEKEQPKPKESTPSISAPLQPKGAEILRQAPNQPAADMKPAEKPFAAPSAAQPGAIMKSEARDNAEVSAPRPARQDQAGGAVSSPPLASAPGADSFKESAHEKREAGKALSARRPDRTVTGEPVDFYFSDGRGKLYHSTEMAENDRIVLIETPALRDSLFIRQRAVIDSMGTEGRLVRMVVACTKEEYREGLHTSVRTAASLSSGGSVFRVRVLTGSGAVLMDSSDVLTNEEILANP